MENWQWIIDIFTFIGMVVCILIALIAIVWFTCYVVKLLVKTFGVRVGKSYELMVEDINKKAEAKKERKELKRKAASAKKMEILNLKLESKQRIHEMKKQKLAENLKIKEEIEKTKIFGENAVSETFEPAEEPVVEKIYEEQKIEEKEIIKNEDGSKQKSKKSNKKNQKKQGNKD